MTTVPQRHRISLLGGPRLDTCVRSEIYLGVGCCLDVELLHRVGGSVGVDVSRQLQGDCEFLGYLC